MKVTIQKAKPEFKPVSVTFTFDSQAELDLMGSLFNSTPVTDTLTKLGLDVSGLYAKFENAGSNPSSSVRAICDEIAKHPVLRIRSSC